MAQAIVLKCKIAHGRILSISPLVMMVILSFLLYACADANVPGGRTASIPAPAIARPNPKAITDAPDSILFVPLGKDVLIPEAVNSDPMPEEYVGPFELRGESLAGALQLILAPFDIPIAFETDEGLNRRITVSNLKGSLQTVIERVCGLADLYCGYEDETLIVKETETFAVSLPPLGEEGAYDEISTGLSALTGVTPTVDNATRTMIFAASQRSSKAALAYFERLRANTALVVFETYIWEVQLTGINSSGIQWSELGSIGAYEVGIGLAGSLSNDVGSPVSIGLPTRGSVSLTTGDIFQFISEQGAVKTISQPQLTVLSGSEATLSILTTENYVESLSRTTDEDGDETVSTTTGSVDSGFTLTIQSSWDESTVYGNISIELEDFLGFEPFNAGSGDTLQLPRTTERSLDTQVRVRPGDSILIAGLVREQDQFDTSGPGFNTPLFPVDRTASTSNTELVFLLRPRVIVYQPAEKIAQAEKEKAQEAVSSILSDENGQPMESDLPIGTLPSEVLNPSVSIPAEEEETEDLSEVLF